MDAHGIHVLDGAHDDDVIGEVPHDLELELLPAGDALLDEGAAHGGGVETVENGPLQLAGVMSDGAALAA